MTDLADFLRYERTMHLAAVARIDERLAGLSPVPLPERTPAACVAVLRAAGRAMRVAEISAVLVDNGRRVREEALYQCMTRLVKAGVEVRRVSAGLYEWTGREER